MLVGQINWLSNQILPDIAFDTRQISVNMHKATIKELYTANETIRKVKSEKVLRFIDIGDIKRQKLLLTVMLHLPICLKENQRESI